MKTRYVNWVENLSWDWCISRQRFFGIPFPAWHCNACAAITLAPDSLVPLDPQEKPDAVTACSSCGSADIRPDTDVMDTWNTSSITPYLCRELFNRTQDNPFAQETVNFVPMSMRPQAHDIIRTWAFYTIAKVWMHHKIIAWNSIVISGHVLAGSKEKLSKSKNNAHMTPEALLETYSADVIRYWTASGNLGYDVAFSEQQLKNGGRLTTKLWNAFLFIEAHIDRTAQPIFTEHKGLVNEWLLHHASQTFEKYTHYLESNEFGMALGVIEHFFWHNFCDNYLELVKNQLFNPEKYTHEEVASTRATLYHVGLSLLQWFAPYVPYVIEELYQRIYTFTNAQKSIHLLPYSVVQKKYDYADNAAIGDRIVELTIAVRALKSQHKLSLKVPFATLTVAGLTERQIVRFQEHEQLIKGVTHAEVVQYVHTATLTLLESIDQVWHATVVLEAAVNNKGAE